VKAARVSQVVLALLLVSGVLWAETTAASAQGERAGNVVVTGGEAFEPGVQAGGSATVFGLDLPADAACQGDSASDNYRVMSFLVPDELDPGSLRYEELKPVGDGAWSLWEESTDPFINALTSQSEGDLPALVSVPRFTFSVLLPGEMSPGDYRIGIACALDNETTRYWDTPFTIVTDSSDAPAQFRWTATAQDVGSTRETGFARPLAVVLIATGVVIGAVALVRRRPNNHSPRSQEKLS
jgi:hypothetical protein